MNAGNSSSPYFTLTLPNEFLTYNVTVAAVNGQGRAQSDVLPVCPVKNREEGAAYDKCYNDDYYYCMLVGFSLYSQ